MAKCKAHGEEIGTTHYIAKSKRYFSDGAILINYGTGWKLHGKLKPGSDPKEVFAKISAKYEAGLSTRPHTKEYRQKLHELAGMGKRWRLHHAVALMPDDPDGVWSECCDGYGDNVHADIDDIANLCRLYKLALTENKSDAE